MVALGCSRLTITNHYQPTALKRLRLIPRQGPSALSFQAKVRAARLARMTIASSMRASVLSHGDDAFGAFGSLARNPNYWRAITRLAAGVRLEASPPQAVLVNSSGLWAWNLHGAIRSFFPPFVRPHSLSARTSLHARYPDRSGTRSTKTARFESAAAQFIVPKKSSDAFANAGGWMRPAAYYRSPAICWPVEQWMVLNEQITDN